MRCEEPKTMGVGAIVAQESYDHTAMAEAALTSEAELLEAAREAIRRRLAQAHSETRMPRPGPVVSG